MESRIFSVSQLANLLKENIEKNIGKVWVSGEVTGFALYPSGHAYFSLKDDKAVLKLVIFSAKYSGINLPEVFGLPSFSSLQEKNIVETKVNGRLIKAFGLITVYPKGGYYQMKPESVEVEGKGDLQKKFEELKNRLLEKGYFTAERKRSIPIFPRTIGIVTSPSGAAIHDMLEIIGRRWNSTDVVIYPALVQGNDAAQDIASGIDSFNRWGGVDVIIIGRGGGSMEDLWAFNEEVVADAIFRSRLPVISAVGHETDFTIADFTADLRAPTPSAAAELVVRDKTEVSRMVFDFRKRTMTSMKSMIDDAAQKLDQYGAERFSSHLSALLLNYKNRLGSFPPMRLAHGLQVVMNQYSLKVSHMVHALMNASRSSLSIAREKIQSFRHRLDALGPYNVLKRGYSITFDADSGTVLKTFTGIHKGRKIRSLLSEGSIISKVEEVSS